MNKRGLILKVYWWPVINLVTLIHDYSYLISLEIVVAYRKLRRFQGAQVNLILSVLLEKEISRNHRGNSRAKLQN